MRAGAAVDGSLLRRPASALPLRRMLAGTARTRQRRRAGACRVGTVEVIQLADLRRRHGRGAALGDLPDPRAGAHRRRESSSCAPASPISTPRCSAPMRCSTCATSASSSGPATSKKPELIGTLPVESGAPEDRAAFLAFGRWLMPRSAAALDHAVAALREKARRLRPGRSRRRTARRSRCRAARAPRMSSCASSRFPRRSAAQARLKLENQRLPADHENMLGLIDALTCRSGCARADGQPEMGQPRLCRRRSRPPTPTRRCATARNSWARQAREAIAAAPSVEAGVRADAVDRDRGRPARLRGHRLRRRRKARPASPCDISDIEAIREEYRAHGPQPCRHARPADHGRRDLRQPTKSCASSTRRSRSCGTSTHGFLASAPDNALLLDRLRSEGKIAEQPEWRRWKENLLARLPRRRVAGALVASAGRPHHPRRRQPAAEGRRHLGVREPDREDGPRKPLQHGGARAGRDARQSGRRRRRVRPRRPHPAVQPGLHRAVGTCRRTSSSRTRTSRTIRARVRRSSPRTARGAGFVAAVTGFDDERRDRHGQAELENGTVLRYAVIHLPNGQVMMTFVDVTDSVNVERALKEKNEALQKADQLKNDFVQHVSYELRSPLTNIIGFTELLSLPATGPLQPAPARICRPYRLVLVGAAHHRQRHPRPGDRRCRHHGARHRRGSASTRPSPAAAELVADRLDEHSITLADRRGARAEDLPWRRDAASARSSTTC